nr:NADH dehydrogenase subunit 2 [Lepidostoma basale]UOU85058.1 NADH dehydrogenase subunit 2 [Lepidostoma basale]
MFNMNLSKFLFFIIMFMSTIFSISSLSLFNMWMGMEINLIAFLPLMINNNNNLSVESMMKYFLIQSLGSANFIFMSTLMISLNKWFSYYLEFNNYFILMIINLTIFLKMGAAPFHFWFPKTMKGISWTNCLILSTWQKIIPLTILSYFIMNNLSMIFIINSAIVGSIMGLNQTSLKLIMSYSSINHISWMISSIMININIWMNYFLFYSILSFILILNFNKMFMNHINQFFSSKSNLNFYFFMFLSFLSLGGLPPFLGFFPKWIVINHLAILNFNFILMILIFSSLINLFFYIRMFYSFLTKNFSEIKYTLLFSPNKISDKILMKLNFFSIFGLTLIFSFFSI